METPSQFKIGGAKHLSVEDARKQAQKLLGRIALGEDPAVERSTLRTVPTLAECRWGQKAASIW